MSENNSNHKIKVPIFSSEMIENEKGMFEEANYLSMIKFIKDKIDKFNQHKPIIKKSKFNKVKETQIANIEYFDFDFESVPTLLLKITAFNTNLIDGFVEIDTKINFKKNHKLGSETNFVLIYPSIYGDDSSSFKYQWKFFIYDDPTKETYEIISIAKLVCNKILYIKIRNLKLENIIKEIREEKILENMEVQLSSFYENSEENDIILRKYVITSKISKSRKTKYENIPSEKFEDLLAEKDDFNRRIIKLIKNNRELRITEERKNDLNKFSQTIEEIFNTQITFDNSNIIRMFENDFIVKNLNSVLTEFIKESK
ncbi:hypothetical protein [Flavobacterium sp. 7A]|uniref:hypothetical protein n=1 Tax=Flavobacterium sp. 7A TaxID=2940571 RepID=UPI0022271F2C|nr:hypothetical protein [Flavobacterium sp. 7A]MCW2119933.1 hypothetical protein [Flavobacterium sp. 7A]